MILLDIVLIGVAVGLLAASLILACRIVRTRDRLVSVAICMQEARILAVARAKLRQRRQRVHDAFDTGTVGLELAHRTVAGRLGSSRAESGERFYQVARDINRGVDSIVSAWLAPRASAGRSSSRKDGDG